MNILMVYPSYPSTFWSFKYVLKFIGKKAAFPPLGMLTVAAMLPDDWAIKMVDTNVDTLHDSQIDWADMIFIGGMIVQKESAQEIITRCKRHNKTIVAGGPVFTTQHQNFTGVDHFVLNEAEVTLPLFLEDLKNGTLKKVYSSMERPDVSKTPVPRWDLIDPQKYAAMAVQYSRGCPFNCEFCDIVIMNGRVPRTKSPDQVVREFQALYDAGWRGSIFVVDDNFIGNKLKAKELLPELISWQKKRKYPFTLLTEASTNLADDEELMNLMTEANFSKVFLGIETPSKDGLKEAGKFQNVSRDLADTVKIIQQHGMQVMGGFIVGFDSDTESIFKTQVEFIQQIGCVVAMVGVLTALPQTRLWHRLKAEGRLLNETSGNNTDVTVNFQPKMGVSKLLSGYREILENIYSTKQYYERIHTFLRNYVPKVRGRVGRAELSALFKSMWKIGVVSEARKYYWRLLGKTLVTKPKAFPVAVELAIYGVHFQQVAEKSLKKRLAY